MIFGAKHSFLKKSLLGRATTECFEPIFGFLGTFSFEKHRSAPWNMIGMFSELSGHSDISYFYPYFCKKLKI
jgi:hypothetical protein